MSPHVMHVMYSSAGISVLYYLSCLGDQHHVYYYLFGALQYITAHLQVP